MRERISILEPMDVESGKHLMARSIFSATVNGSRLACLCQATEFDGPTPNQTPPR